MAFLYTFLNIILPLSLLSYFTFTRMKNKGKVQYGQWFLLIISIAIFNIFFVLFHFTWITFIIDLGIKLGSVFIPKKMNDTLQQKIKEMHLQVYVDMIRSKIIGQFFKVHCLLTQYLLGKMSDIEAKQFKNTLIQRLTHLSQTPYNQIRAKNNHQYQKIFNSIGVECNIDEFSSPIKPEINQFRNRVQSNFQKNRQKNIVASSSPQMHAKDLRTITFGGRQQQHPTQFKVYPTYNQPHTYYNKPKQQAFIKPQIPQIHRSYSPNKSAYQPQFPHNDNNVSSRFTVMSSPLEQNIINYHRQVKPTFHELKQSKIKHVSNDYPDKILQNIEGEVSSYSMIQNQQQISKKNNVLVCKVQAIVQIGGNYSTNRLQFYTLQLYDNGELRIVSATGRQFERHRLFSIKPLENNYYDLYFAGGKKRKVKFRGNAQAFMKYL